MLPQKDCPWSLFGKNLGKCKLDMEMCFSLFFLIFLPHFVGPGSPGRSLDGSEEEAESESRPKTPGCGGGQGGPLKVQNVHVYLHLINHV